ncbi:hypothetical protein JR316_0006719 [Psilocybe cubensis]|uniref:Protein kinase domain-containing protein n=2 Tax=Psilocybe cubensis TaxID=181762 RepID=A0A8H8CEY7_PSICU|nr:hypothetical protein JR316_0006719 [Psilocybe cubensis]KAH9480122.1 hypothetical protein JR316_0006719 [Psilocybe cubensis]
MPDNNSTYAYVHLGLLTVATLVCLFSSGIATFTEPEKLLPTELRDWRNLDEEDYDAAWDELLPLFKKHGYQLWKRGPGLQSHSGGHLPCDNFLFLTPDKTKNISIVRWPHFINFNGLSHAARSINAKRDAILRLVASGGQGGTHLRIMRRLSSPPDILMSNNHILPFIDEISYQDIVVLSFPKLISSLQECLDTARDNSVEDILYMVAQTFEGAAYLHRKLIGHRDLFLNNIMVEWMPASLRERRINRPRVYIIDFETAVDFSDDSAESERLCKEHPFAGIVDIDTYGRPVAPELSGEIQPYCPFKLDMWQLGSDLNDYVQTGLKEVDEFWTTLVSPIPDSRVTAADALTFLHEYLLRTSPSELHRPLPEQVSVTQ